MNRERIKAILPEVEKLIALSKEYQRKLNNGVSSYLADVEVNSYLSKFDLTDIILIEALMYIGREDYIPRERYESEVDYYREVEEFYERYDVDDIVGNKVESLFRNSDTKLTRIEQMVSKTPLSQYLEQGLHVIRVKRKLA
ncbi:hypothetical protein BC351_10365 [Paenibacillus ferrarius]|uniref:Uncharacterized protein n=1 Tax=Paenibacillus ferrarius TaxID=1469647 RepID=A0A1V4H8Z6_9BACL|nr:DUF3775 domain-containing protein [Paenibacillus ferrarius]OPH47586.1 hypothetical protein BC351_10365 [Paenibacillus ferrarius]